MSEIENHILDILDANPQGLDHEKLARQVKAVANVQTGTINIAISTLERNGRISKGLGIRYQIVRPDKSARKTTTAAEREEQVLAGFAAEPLLTINEITDVLALDRSSVDVIVKRMIEKGLIADSGQTRGLGPGRAAILYKRIDQSPAPAAGAAEPAPTGAATTTPTSIALDESLDDSERPMPDKERVWQCFTSPKSARDVAEEIGLAANKVSGHVHWLLNAGRLKVALSTDLSTGGRHYLQSELTDPSAIEVEADASIHDEQGTATAPAAPAITFAEKGKGVISMPRDSLLSSIPDFTKGGPVNRARSSDHQPRSSMQDTASNSNFIIAPSRVSVFEKGKPDDAIHIEVETPTGGGIPFVRIWGGDDGVEDALTLTLAELDAVTGAARTLLKQREEATA